MVVPYVKVGGEGIRRVVPYVKRRWRRGHRAKIGEKKGFVFYKSLVIIPPIAGVAELVDAPDSKSGGGDIVRVRFSPPVP